MPNYDYKCNQCGITMEVFKQLGNDSVPVCCGASMEKIWYATPTIFKTGGFYKTGG
jgi:putative FmdB family regulatory protein